MSQHTIITSRKIKARYVHFGRVTDKQRYDLATATDILYRTHWYTWADRRRRRWARGVLRDARKTGLARWFKADPFVWPPPGE
jgi:hypothetical protein